MELGENIKDSIKYPISDIKNFIIFTVISIFSFLIIPIPLITGYLYKVMEETIDGNDILPEFDDFGEIFVNGLKLVGVIIIYAIIITIIMGIIGAIGGILANAIGDTLGAIILFLMMAVMIILAIIFELILIPVPVNMILNEGSFGAAFDFSGLIELIKGVGIGQYIIWYIILAVIIAIAGVVSGLLSMIIIGIFGFTWIYLFQARSTALLFGFE